MVVLVVELSNDSDEFWIDVTRLLPYRDGLAVCIRNGILVISSVCV